MCGQNRNGCCCTEPGILGPELQGHNWPETRPDFVSRRQFIESFDFSPYVRAAEPLDRDEEAELINEFRRFMILAAEGVAFELRAMRLDQIWHEFITDSVVYHRFCRGAFGYYLHHIPAGSDIVIEPNLDEMVSAYAKLFGGSPPKNIWNVEPELIA